MKLNQITLDPNEKLRINVADSGMNIVLDVGKEHLIVRLVDVNKGTTEVIAHVPIEPAFRALEEYSPVSFEGNTDDQDDTELEWEDGGQVRKARLVHEPMAPTQLTEQARAAAGKAKAEVIEAARAKLEYMTKKDFRKSWNDHPWFAMRHVFKDETVSWISGEMWFIHDRLEIQQAMEARGYTGVTTFSMDHGSDAAGPRYTRIALAFDRDDKLTYFYYD